MSTLSIIPETHDIDYILLKMNQAGVTNHFGFSREENGIHLRYRAADFDTVQSILDSYQVDYANEVLRGRLLIDVTNLRREKQIQPTTFMGMSIPTDDVTVGRITAATYLMDANPNSPQTRRWKVADGIWMTLDRNTLVAMGTAIAEHVQQCFEREENLHAAINMATTVDELNAIDIQSGWPV